MNERFETLSVDKELNFFISYRWDPASKKEADRICEQLVLYQINPIRDVYILKYGESIKNYMDNLSACDGAILIISKDYFFSLNCMYEGIIAMQNCKNRTQIRMVDNSVYSNEFKKKILEFWKGFDAAGIFGDDEKKLELVRDNYQKFVSWISDTNSVLPNDINEFKHELNKHIGKIAMESFDYSSLVKDLCVSKDVIISKVCDPTCEEHYHYKNINYSVQESPVKYFKCFFNFIITLEKCDTKESVDIAINNVVGIQAGNFGTNFSKYYFVIPTQNSLDTLAFEEKIGKRISEIEYDRRRVIINM